MMFLYNSEFEWKRPPSGFIKMNCDASWKHNLGGGIGIVAKDSEGDGLGVRAIKGMNVSSSPVSEGMGLLESFIMAEQINADKEKNHGAYDFIFVDADKDNYINYHKLLIDLVKVGGVIGYDNTLWNGSVVAAPDAPMRKYVRYYRDFVMELLNKALAADPRIEICMLSVGDGITLCRRVK
ncbi:hypothetical protein QQ045_019831 [Rhodiola kirilowii]